MKQQSFVHLEWNVGTSQNSAVAEGINVDGEPHLCLSVERSRIFPVPSQQGEASECRSHVAADNVFIPTDLLMAAMQKLGLIGVDGSQISFTAKRDGLLTNLREHISLVTRFVHNHESIVDAIRVAYDDATTMRRLAIAIRVCATIALAEFHTRFPIDESMDLEGHDEEGNENDGDCP